MPEPMEFLIKLIFQEDNTQTVLIDGSTNNPVCFLSNHIAPLDHLLINYCMLFVFV